MVIIPCTIQYIFSYLFVHSSLYILIPSHKLVSPQSLLPNGNHSLVFCMVDLFFGLLRELICITF